jgi:hypothetical protein
MPLAGIVSTAPGMKLNTELEGGTYIALKGRVPVKIYGNAIKGQYINAVKGGFGVPSNFKNETTVGICLEDGDVLVEVKV